MFFNIRDKIFYRLNTKITAAIVLSLITVLGTSTFFIEKIEKEDALGRAQETGDFITSTILRNLEYHMLKNDREAIDFYLEGLTGAQEIRSASVTGNDGNIVYSTNKKAVGMKLSTNFLSLFIDGHGDRAMNLGFKAGERILSVVTNIYNKKDCYGCHDANKKTLGMMIVDISMTSTDQAILNHRKTLVFSSIIAILTVSLILYIMNNRYMYAPLKKLNRIIEGVKKGDLSIKEDFAIKDELGHLGVSLNNMVESLNDANKKLKESYIKQLHQSEKLAAVGQLASGIIHEIQSPLTGVAFSLETIRNKMQDDSDTKNILDLILVHINKVMQMARELLMFVKTSKPLIESVNLNKIVEGALFFVSNQAEKQKVNITADLAENLPEIQASPDSIKQVFLNLLLNAIQSMPSGGRLEITSGVSDDSNNLYVSFADSGTGIPDNEVNKIFNPFYTTKENGTGLGLFISKSIIDAHGGEILVETKQGPGAVFTVKLPMNRI